MFPTLAITAISVFTGAFLAAQVQGYKEFTGTWAGICTQAFSSSIGVCLRNETTGDLIPINYDFNVTYTPFGKYRYNSAYGAVSYTNVNGTTVEAGVEGGQGGWGRVSMHPGIMEDGICMEVDNSQYASKEFFSAWTETDSDGQVFYHERGDILQRPVWPYLVCPFSKTEPLACDESMYTYYCVGAMLEGVVINDYEISDETESAQSKRRRLISKLKL